MFKRLSDQFNFNRESDEEAALSCLNRLHQLCDDFAAPSAEAEEGSQGIAPWVLRS